MVRKIIILWVTVAVVFSGEPPPGEWHSEEAKMLASCACGAVVGATSPLLWDKGDDKEG